MMFGFVGGITRTIQQQTVRVYPVYLALELVCMLLLGCVPGSAGPAYGLESRVSVAGRSASKAGGAGFRQRRGCCTAKVVWLLSLAGGVVLCCVGGWQASCCTGVSRGEHSKA